MLFLISSLLKTVYLKYCIYSQVNKTLIKCQASHESTLDGRPIVIVTDCLLNKPNLVIWLWTQLYQSGTIITQKITTERERKIIKFIENFKIFKVATKLALLCEQAWFSWPMAPNSMSILILKHRHGLVTDCHRLPSRACHHQFK